MQIKGSRQGANCNGNDRDSQTSAGNKQPSNHGREQAMSTVVWLWCSHGGGQAANHEQRQKQNKKQQANYLSGLFCYNKQL